MSKLYIFSIKLRRLIYAFSVILIILISFIIFNKTSIMQTSAKGSDVVINTGGKLAIIIDDFGQNRAGVKEMMSIDRSLTFAVMPFLEFSEEDALTAHEKGFEVIAHLPLEANGGIISWVGPRPILSSMKNQEIKQITLDTFNDIPFAVGANIHMGSKAGCDEHVIVTILSIIKEKNLYFVDSRSAEHPIAKGIAGKMKVTCFERNVFLDGGRSKYLIKEQLKKALDIALKKGKAIAIGHVGTEGGTSTAEAIEEMLPEFDRNNVDLVFVSELKY